MKFNLFAQLTSLFIPKSDFITTKEGTKNWLHQQNINQFKINDDLSVDVYEHVDLSPKKLMRIPVQFGRVEGNFDCSGNSLVSLKGSPHTVNGSFNCAYNNLSSLKGGPKKVDAGFMCRKNKLTSLEHSPQTVNGQYDCSNNELITLKGAPNHIKQDFYCCNNRLTALEGAPQKVEGRFIVTQNPIQSLNHNTFSQYLGEVLLDSNIQKNLHFNLQKQTDGSYEIFNISAQELCKLLNASEIKNSLDSTLKKHDLKVKPVKV